MIEASVVVEGATILVHFVVYLNKSTVCIIMLTLTMMLPAVSIFNLVMLVFSVNGKKYLIEGQNGKRHLIQVANYSHTTKGMYLES